MQWPDRTRTELTDNGWVCCSFPCPGRPAPGQPSRRRGRQQRVCLQQPGFRHRRLARVVHPSLLGCRSDRDRPGTQDLPAPARQRRQEKGRAGQIGQVYREKTAGARETPTALPAWFVLPKPDCGRCCYRRQHEYQKFCLCCSAELIVAVVSELGQEAAAPVRTGQEKGRARKPGRVDQGSCTSRKKEGSPSLRYRRRCTRGGARLRVAILASMTAQNHGQVEVISNNCASDLLRCLAAVLSVPQAGGGARVVAATNSSTAARCACAACW